MSSALLPFIRGPSSRVRKVALPSSFAPTTTLQPSSAFLHKFRLRNLALCISLHPTKGLWNDLSWRAKSRAHTDNTHTQRHTDARTLGLQACKSRESATAAAVAIATRATATASARRSEGVSPDRRALQSRGVLGAQEAASAMQNYKYDKAIAPESKNGGSPALNNSPRRSGSKRVLLICLDLFCLFMGEHCPAGSPGAPRCQFSPPDFPQGADPASVVSQSAPGPRPRPGLYVCNVGVCFLGETFRGQL